MRIAIVPVPSDWVAEMKNCFNFLRIALALLLVCALRISPAAADDTEIYQAEFSAEAGGRPKVLVVFDDSGSMSTMVSQQKPEYDPNGSYQETFDPNRIYWSTDGSIPDERVRINGSWQDNPNWFYASQNRCASSYDPLDDLGSFTANRALRWKDSETIQDQCGAWQCPAGQFYLNDYQGSDGAGCYAREETAVPRFKLVYLYQANRGWERNNCRDDGNYVGYDWDSRRYNCYSYERDDSGTGGYYYTRHWGTYRSCGRDRNIELDSLPTNEAGDSCWDYTTGTQNEIDVADVRKGDATRQCEDIFVPGEWISLSSGVHNLEPGESVSDLPHVECLNDVTDRNDGNGSGMPNGYPQDNVATGSEYGPEPDNGVDWGNQAYTFYTSHWLDYHYDDSLEEDKSRLEIAQEVLTSLIRTNPGIDFGLMEFNYNEGGRIVQRIIQNMDTDDRTNLIDMVNRIDHAGSTPICESMYEAYRYIAGLGVVYGDDARSGSDSRGTYDVLSRDMSAESNGTYISPNTDCAYTYVIFLTDGFPQSDTGANSAIETLTGKTCSRYQDADGDNTKNCLPELAEYMATTDLDGDDSNGDQLGITYTIGFTQDQDLLKDAAAKGKGKYYLANNAQELTEAFQGALVGILSTDTTFTSPAVAVDTFTRTQSRNEVFYAMFKPSSSVDWIGNIKKLRLRIQDGEAVLVDSRGYDAIDSTTGYIKDSATTYWSGEADGGFVDKGGVGGLLAARSPATRNIYSNIGASGALERFNSANVTPAAMGVATNDDLYRRFNVSNSTGLGRILAWAQGYDAYDDDDDGRIDDTRKWPLGDILHSQPAIINYGARTGFSASDPDLRIVVGTNSGFIHMFGDDNGQEDWAFFPKELAGILVPRQADRISNDNIYGMDLTPVVYTVDQNADGTLDSGAGDKAWLFIGQRRGGRSYYALNVSNPDSPQFMWRIGPDVGGFSELGQSWSQPVVTRIPGYVDDAGNSKPVLIFGAGYDTNKDSDGVGRVDTRGRGLFIVDAETGSLIWSVSPGGTNTATHMVEPGLLHSVPAEVTVIDSNADELTDRIYFGDTGGNLWRVDLAGNSLPDSAQDSWYVTRLADFNPGLASEDRRFFNAPDVVKVRIDGVPVDAVIIGSGDRTNPVSTDVQDRLYLFRDYAVNLYTTTRPSISACEDEELTDFRCSLPVSDGDLFNITSGLLQSDDEQERLDAETALQGAAGWYLNLQGAGEKSLAKTLTINGKVFAATFTPSNLLSDINVCEPQSGNGMMYVIDLYDGARSTLALGGVIPDTPSVHFGSDGKVRMLLPPGTPPGDIDDDDGDGDGDGGNCVGGVCDVDATLPAPYGNYWFQEEF
ncbi:pilus assembly protein [Parahaliea aestuarii]|nr:PilC/PilY family type IV pilus protein [Parahaliea aestuarii]